MNKINPLILVILDGYGKGKKYVGNAISLAKKPFIDYLNKTYPHTLLKASGNAVGVPKGIAGASEPGHITLGAGRIVWQPLEEINRSIKNKTFFQKQPFLDAINIQKQNQSSIHLIGMLSDGRIHSDQTHLYALLKLFKKKGIKDSVHIHIISDGRDVPERSISKYLNELKAQIKQIGVGEISSIIGRFYAMDRDNNWDRTKTAYDLFTKGKGEITSDFIKNIKQFYKTSTKSVSTDYYLPPILSKPKFQPIKDKDSVIFFNFRSDRAKQLTSAFTNKNFPYFKTKIYPYFVCMGPYSDTAPIVFPPNTVKNNLGETISKNNLRQLRISETEKYAHVTFFFNSQNNTPYKGETRILIDSPKVKSYADSPQMSAKELTNTVIKEIKKKKFEFILINYPNPDLVGHSGDIKAVIKAIEYLDKCIKPLTNTAIDNGYQMIITADHGNAEEMLYYGTDIVSPAHTNNPVNCIVISEKTKKLKQGKGLKDIAPTILDLMGIKKPKEMTGESLILI